MTMQQRSIPCSCDPQTWILTPSMGLHQDVTNAVIDMQQSVLGDLTGTLSYAGQVRAFLTFDDSGRVIGYTLTVNDDSTQRSVENILTML